LIRNYAYFSVITPTDFHLDMSVFPELLYPSGNHFGLYLVERSKVIVPGTTVALLVTEGTNLPVEELGMGR
jgi:hypothetical protein